VKNYQRDGSMTVDANMAGAPNYFPNSFSGPAADAQVGMQSSIPLTGENAQRYETGDEDNFSQVKTFFNEVLDEAARERLTDNIAGHMVNAQDFIQQRAIANFAAADERYGQMIADKIAGLKRSQQKTRASRRAAPLNPPRAVPTFAAKAKF